MSVLRNSCSAPALDVTQLTSTALSEKFFRRLPVLDSAHCDSTAVPSRQSDAANGNVRISLDEEFASYDGVDLQNFKKEQIRTFPFDCQHVCVGGPTFPEFCHAEITEGCGGGRRVSHSIVVFRWP